MDWQPFKIVKVVWSDAVSIDEWTEVDLIANEPSHKIISVGHLIRETEDCVVLCLNYDMIEQMASCSMVIPKKFFLEPIEVLCSQ
jgi:hypothetical protein